ncbi:hypothetical protein K2Y11_02610 [bacterium]|nr:hypothetical protein [bacterium]
MKLSNQSLGLLFAGLMVGLIVTAILYRRYGGHEPIRPVARESIAPAIPSKPSVP